MTLKYREYLRFYLIKIKSVFSNFGSEKQFKEKKIFMTTEIDFIGEKWPFWQTHPFWMKIRLNSYKLNKIDTLRKKHERRYPSTPVRPCTHFGWLLSIPPFTYVLNGWPISQPKKQIRTFEHRIYWNYKKNFLRKYKWYCRMK